MDFCGLCCNNSKIEDNTCKTCEQLNKMQEEYNKMQEKYAKLLDYHERKEQNRKNKINAKIQKFQKDGLLEAEIKQVKDKDSNIFKATRSELQIIDNEGNSLKDARYHINGILVSAGVRNIDKAKQAFTSERPKIFYKDTKGLYKEYKDEDINNEEIKAKNMIVAFQLK